MLKIHWKNPLSFLIIFFITGVMSSQTLLHNIPDSLIEKSHYILLKEDYVFTIENKSNIVEEVKKDFVVLKKSKHVPSYLTVGYDDFTKNSNLKVWIYDKNNKLIKKYSGKDFNKSSASYGQVANDHGVKYFMIPDLTTPYRVVFSYKVKSSNSLFYPDWMPVTDEFQSILSANLTVIDKTGDNLRYKLYNIDEPKKYRDKGKTIYKWTVNNRKYIEFEDFNNNADEYLPKLILAPKKFEFGGYEGNMNNWASFSNWIELLNKEQNDFTSEQKLKIKALVKNTDSKWEKIKKIYQYLQDNMHYADIELGIGGWQPMKTSFVDEKKYGDCKALTFYAKSMMDLIGIESYYTLVKAGKYASSVPGDFSNARFNHAFLTVPIENDTIWLECTSQIHPCGYNGSFTDDRNVLLIKSQGGKLIRSRKYSAAENKNIITANIDLDKEGNAMIELTDKMVGLAIERNGYMRIIKKGKDKQKKWLYDNLNLSSFKILDFEIKPFTNEIITKGSYGVKIEVKKFARKVGKNLILKPFDISPVGIDKLTKKTRKHNIHIRRAYELEDSITIKIPEGFEVKSSTKNIITDSKFGKYSIIYQVSEDSIILKRKIIINKGSYSPDNYNEFRAFINKLIKKCNKSIVLSKSKL